MKRGSMDPVHEKGSMDPVHERGSMDPVHILMDLVHGGGPCFVLSLCPLQLSQTPYRLKNHGVIVLTGWPAQPNLNPRVSFVPVLQVRKRYIPNSLGP